jgi:RNA polymerase sigma factor (sigma-70 family)
VPGTTVQQSLGLLRQSSLEREFERLYQRYVADVYRYALYVLRDGAEAEDVTQAAFLNAFRAFQRGERPHKPRSWLLTIVHNECRRYFRTKSRRLAEVELDERLTADLAPDEDVPTPEEIRRALGELSFNHRSALVMRELEGRSYAEIAETLDLSVSAVETLLFRARRALREQLEGALTCGEAELALSKQLDKRLSSEERAGLRAHLRACKECSRLARRQRAQRTALRTLGPVPLPGSLTSLFGGGGGTTGGLLAGGSALGGGVALKAAVVLAGGAVATGMGLGAAMAGSALQPASTGNVAPVRLAALATPGSASGGAAAVAPARGDAVDSGAAAVRLGPVSARMLDDDVEAGPASSDAGPRARGPEAGPKGNGAGAEGDRGTQSTPLPQPGPVQLPKVPVATPQPSAPVPAVRVPRAPVPTPPIPRTEPPAPQVTVPTAPQPPAVQPPPVPPVPPVEVPPLPPPPKLP